MLIEYIFNFEDGREFHFPIAIDSGSMTLISSVNEEFPDWAKLEQNQCGNCPLEREDYPYCPAAKNLCRLVEATKNELSHSRADVTVVTAERTYQKETDLQTGLFSIMGLLIALSECPHFAPLKPLARFHLPFATMEETLFRTCGSYLLECHLRGKPLEMSLDKLEHYYQHLATVNTGIIKRIKSASEGDADRNAVIMLGMLSQMFAVEYQTNFSSLNEIINCNNDTQFQSG